MWRYIYNQVKEKYGDLVELIEENNDLFEYYQKPSKKPIQFRVFPDLTNLIDTYKSDKKSALARLHVQRRHIMSDMLEQKFGYLINVFVIHRTFGVPPVWSTDSDIYLIRSYPDNPFDQKDYEKRFGIDALQYLHKLELLRENDDHYIGYGIIKTRSVLESFYTPRLDQ